MEGTEGENKIRDAADATKGILEATPVYQDAVQPLAKQVGTALETVGKAVNVALAPIGAVIWGYEKITEWLVPELEDRLSRTPPEQIVTPRPMLAGPAIEALRFAGHEESLRDLYANLLATAMDGKAAHTAHPAFVEILAQITPDEAKLLKHISEIRADFRSFVNLRAMIDAGGPGRGGSEVARHFSTLGEAAECGFPELTPTYLTNLQRLGVLALDSASHWTSDEADAHYAALEAHPRMNQLCAHIDAAEHRTPKFVRGTIRITALGDQFIEACVVDRRETVDEKQVAPE